MGAVHDIIGDGREIPAALLPPSPLSFPCFFTWAHYELVIFLLAGIFQSAIMPVEKKALLLKTIVLLLATSV